MLLDIFRMPSKVTKPTSQVYTSYDTTNPPKHPGHGWTRFVCISDTHSKECFVPPGDILLHSGDLSSWGYPDQLEKTLEWLESLPHPAKIIIAGNHDLCLDEQWAEGGYWEKENGEAFPLETVQTARARIRGQKAIQANLHYLEYETMSITTKQGRTWEVYGSPAVPRYAPGSFQYIGGSADGETIHALIPSTTEILLTHTPPHGICDLSKKGKHAGCPALAARLNNGELSRCRLHIFGHIHEAHGAAITPADGTSVERVSVNGAIPDTKLAIIVDLLN